jgi:hypothetical protein
MRALQPLRFKVPLVDARGIIDRYWVAWFEGVASRLGLRTFTIIQAKFAAASITNEYTVPSGATVVIDSFTATNTHVSAVTI